MHVHVCIMYFYHHAYITDNLEKCMINSISLRILYCINRFSNGYIPIKQFTIIIIMMVRHTSKLLGIDGQLGNK